MRKSRRHIINKGRYLVDNKHLGSFHDNNAIVMDCVTDREKMVPRVKAYHTNVDREKQTGLMVGLNTVAVFFIKQKDVLH